MDADALITLDREYIDHITQSAADRNMNSQEFIAALAEGLTLAVAQYYTDGNTTLVLNCSHGCVAVDLDETPELCH